MDNKTEFTPDEMRMIRREWINLCLYKIHFHLLNNSLETIKYYVRAKEIQRYGIELKRYQ